MKKRLLILRIIVLLGCIQNVNGQTPVAYYPFSGNANDAIGTNNGTVNGATLTTDRFGNANSAFSFDGIDDAISTATVATTNIDNWTMSAWVKPASINQFDGTIVINGSDNGVTGNGYTMCMGNGIGSAAGNIFTGFHNGLVIINSGSAFAISNTWYHVVMVREAGVTKFYLNGSQTANTSNNTPAVPSGAVKIGSVGGLRFWNGVIDEVKIYNIALSASQILAEYNNSSQSPIPQTNLKMWLRGDDGITKDGSNKISAWADQSANNKVAVQTDAAKQPMWVSNVINGHAVVRYAAVVEDYLRCNYQGPNTTEVTMFVVAQGSNISSVIRFQNEVAASSGFLIYGYTHNTANNGFCMSNDGADINGINCGFFNNPALQIGTARWKANTTNGMQTFIDGALLAQRNSNNSVLPNDSLGIGSGNGSGNNQDENTIGDVAEIIIYDRALTDAEKRQVETYLNVKYRVTNNLATSKPGSGNAISFDGFDDGIEVTNNAALNFPGDLTVEAWIKLPATQNNTANSDNAIIEKWGGSNASIGYPFVIRYYKPSHSVIFARYNGSTSVGIDGVAVVDDNKWHHIAATKAGSVLSLYIDGILQGNTADFNDLTNVNNTQNLNIGTRGPIAVGPNQLTGSIDEIRIWNAGLTQLQIRDRICQKITSNDALYNNLVAYYNFDESTGTAVFDGSLNSNHGTMTNGPARVTSGAAIGNASAHDYINTTKAVSIAHASGETFTVTSTAGNPAAIHVYRIDEQPNTLTGASGVGTNNKYFGVFQIAGTNPEYTAVYNYNGNPLVTTGNESILTLFKRTDNASTWSGTGAVLNTTTKTLTLSGVSTEYILGTASFSLPLQLLQFSAKPGKSAIAINWQTTLEKQVSHFQVQRSADGFNFYTIGQLPALNTSKISQYQFVDENPLNSINYYRLKMTDDDGKASLSKIESAMLPFTQNLILSPNPATHYITLSLPAATKLTIAINDAAGRLIKQYFPAANITRLQLDISTLTKGLYWLSLSTESKIITRPFIKE